MVLRGDRQVLSFDKRHQPVMQYCTYALYLFVVETFNIVLQPKSSARPDMRVPTCSPFSFLFSNTHSIIESSISSD